VGVIVPTTTIHVPTLIMIPVTTPATNKMTLRIGSSPSALVDVLVIDHADKTPTPMAL
jgi:hypothetical protein